MQEPTMPPHGAAVLSRVAGAVASTVTELGVSLASTAAPVVAPTPTADAPSTVVGLGASAGGLEALDRFFSALPACGDTAFVIVQHLSPDHKTLMGDLLGRHTPMPVAVAEHNTPLRRGHVYLIPPGKTMTLVGDRLHLAPKPTQGLSFPIDDFFISLAEHWGPHAVGLILSGTGSDGSRGLHALHLAGAWTLVQEPGSAKFDGMPRAAIALTSVDKVLPPEELAREVELCSRHLRPTTDPVQATESALDVSLEVLHLLLQNTGIDFEGYKPTMVFRRIERRMHAAQLSTMAAYLDRLRTHPAEVVSLRKDLLIPVTRFFRDPESFQLLRQKVIDPLTAARKGTSSSIRVWVAACSTGEEAYTIAILLAESLRLAGSSTDFKVFATDVEPNSIEIAGSGRFSERISEDVAPDLLKRWFRRTDSGFEIDPGLRQRIVFARHDLLNDASFTQMDLVSCRNMLIYLRPHVQLRVLRALQYGLRTGGALLLGSSESLPADMQPDFDIVDARHKLYLLARRPALMRDELFMLGGRMAHATRLADLRERDRHPELASTNRGLDLLLQEYAPAAMLISAQRRLLHLYGPVRQWLRFKPGAASLDVLELLPRELAAVASTMVHVALRDRVSHRSVPLTARRPDDTEGAVRLAVWPIGEASNPTEELLLCIEPVAPSGVAQASVDGGSAALVPALQLGVASQEQVADLERELAATRGNLQNTIQDLGTANEELQATNEELIASNEELQSTNEELQSLNEELNTINSEFQEKITQLHAANADLETLARALQQPVLFVDATLQVQRFSPEVKQLFKLRESDIGRPLDELQHVLDYPELYADIRRAIGTGVAVSREVRAFAGDWYLLRVLPYTDAGKVKRAVISAIDVSHLKDAQHLQAVIDALPQHLAVLDARGVILSVNAAWRAFAAANGDPEMRRSGPGTSYLDCCAASPDDSHAQRAAQAIDEVIAGRREGFAMEYPCHSPDEQRWFLMQVAPLRAEGGGCIVSHINITGWVARPVGSSLIGSK